MNFKIGDYVRFINERQEGIVTAIIDHQLVGVTIDGDFEITVLGTEIVLVNQRENQLNGEASANASPHTAQIPEGNLADKGIFLVFLPDEKIINLLHLHLVNNTDYQVNFLFITEKQKIYTGEKSDMVKPRHFSRIGTYSVNDFEKWPKMHFQLLYFREGAFQLKQPLLISNEFKSKNFFKSESTSPVINKKGYTFQIDEEQYQIDARKMTEELFRPKEEIREIFLPEKEVDLHIEDLREDFQKMSAQEILQVQLEAFRRNLEAAIAHHYSSIIFIHGLGNGTLRNEIHKQLGKHPHIRTFKDARKEKFGYGATEVIIK